MLTFLAILHVIIGLCLIVFVLLQDPKDGAAGIFGGGSSSKSFFGSTGASDFLSTATKWLAVLFAGSCLLLTAITTKHSTSVMDEGTIAPAAPANAPLAQPNAPEAKPTEEQKTPAPATPATPDSDKHE
jgi:preprotein translocase subunit SecG